MSASSVINKKLCFAGRCILVMLLSIFVLFSELACRPAAAASDFNVTVHSVAQIRFDDDGRRLGYPISVFYDPTEDEIYAVNGTSGRVVVYGPDFFPRTSIGVGRGIGAPRGGEVEPNGDVYICQAHFRKSSAHQITILNGAFFVKRKINLDDIPQAKGMSPNSVAVNRKGVIYVAGDNTRGVLVLDKEGTFLRWIKPEDKILASPAVFEAAKQQDGNGEEKQPEQTQAASGEKDEQTPAKVDLRPDIPGKFRPRSSSDDQSTALVEGRGPVKVNYVTIDSTGRLYLLSAETGRVYVYGPDEKFLFAFGTKGGSPRQMSQPRALAIDENRGMIYIVDYMRHTILTYDLSGKFLFEFGGRGTGPCWFNFPCGIAVNRHGQVIVADQFNKRIQVLDVEQPPFLGMPAAAASPDGSDSGGTTTQKASPSDQGAP